MFQVLQELREMRDEASRENLDVLVIQEKRDVKESLEMMDLKVSLVYVHHKT